MESLQENPKPTSRQEPNKGRRDLGKGRAVEEHGRAWCEERWWLGGGCGGGTVRVREGQRCREKGASQGQGRC